MTDCRMALLCCMALTGLAAAAYPVFPEFKNDETRIRDPFVLADEASGAYFLYQAKRLSPTSCGVVAFRSKDLKTWTKGVVAMATPPEWGNAAVWAAEVFKWNGAYWMFATITLDPDPKNPIESHWIDGKSPDPPERMPKLQPRGTWIFRSNSPTGLFVPWSKGPITPPEWMCLDGTLVEHEGHPYMVYCREWVQWSIGWMDAIRMKDDLSGAVGKPVPLFRSMTDFCANVRSSRVTDGPFCWRSEKSGKLFMIWSSHRTPPRHDKAADYNVLLCESETGSPLGPWKMLKCIYQHNGGHGMIFKDLSGRPKLCLHAPNRGPGERIRFFDLIDDGETLSLDIPAEDRVDAAAFTPWDKVKPSAPKVLPTGCPDFEVEPPRKTAGRVLDAADFGFSKDNDDNAAAINRALARCKAVGASGLKLASGTYRCFGKDGIRLEKFADFTLDGRGAMLVFRRESRKTKDSVRWKQEPDAANLTIRDCVRTEVKGLEMDWDWANDPLGIVATCVNVHTDRADNASFADFRLVSPRKHPAYPNPVPIQTLTARRDAVRVRLADGRGPHGYFGLAQGHFGTKNEWIAEDTLRVWPYVKQEGVFQTREFDGCFTAEENRRFTARLAAGTTYALSHYYYGMNGVVMDSNRDLTIRDFAIHSCRGLGFEVRGNQRGWQLVNVKIAPPKGTETPREITCTADGFHIARSCGRCKFVNCEWTLHEDDSINSHDRTTLARKSGPRTLEVVNNRGTAYFGAVRGDEIELREENFAPTGWRGRIAAVEGNSYVFDRDLPDHKGLFFVLFNRSYGTGDILIRGCTFHNTPWARNLILGSNVTVENCAFEGVAGTPLRFQACYSHNVWCEGTGATNIVVRNCVFRDAADNYLVNGISSQIYAGVRIPFREDAPERHLPIADARLRAAVEARDARGERVLPWPGLVTGVLVEKCRFINPRGLVWHILNGGEMTFRDNDIELGCDAPYPYLPYAGSLFAERAAKVNCSGNRFKAAADISAGIYGDAQLKRNDL